MNSKKARSIRQKLAAKAVNVREVSYIKTLHPHKQLFNPDGSFFMTMFTTKRTKDCGRSMYQQAKLAAQ